MPKIHMTVGAIGHRNTLLAASKNGGSVVWPVPKDALILDHVLFIVPSLHGPICAVGSVISKTEKSKIYTSKYEAKIDRIIMLKKPISMETLQEKFPDWSYVTNTKGQNTVNRNQTDDVDEAELMRMVREACR